MVDYVQSAATATRLIGQFGRDVTLKQYTIGTYDPILGTNAVTITDRTTKAAIFDFAEGQTLQAGNLIQAGDKRCLMNVSYTPNLQDHVVIGSKEYVILSVGEVNPAGTAILFELHLRAG